MLHPFFDKFRTTVWDTCEDIVGPWSAEGWGSDPHQMWFFDEAMVAMPRERMTLRLRTGARMRKAVTDKNLRDSLIDRIYELYSLPVGNPHVETHIQRDGLDWVATIIVPLETFEHAGMRLIKGWSPATTHRGELELTRDDLSVIASMSPALAARVVFQPKNMEFAFMRSPRSIAFMAAGCYVVQAYGKEPHVYLQETQTRNPG